MHGGIAFYTVGQRKGIGHHRGNPKYVVEINRKDNSIVIGDAADTLHKELFAEEVSFISGELPAQPLEVTAKIRYNAPAAEAIVSSLGDFRAQINFKNPQRAITPGQAVVFYRGDEVLGGGTIN
jgi:tRNA-specific 2-thiouridylase